LARIVCPLTQPAPSLTSQPTTGATSDGRPSRPEQVRTINEVVELVARGRVVHPTVASLAGLFDRSDVVLVPAPELPPWPLGLIWYTAHENARIRALAAVAVR
jgi:hypothetical protein